MSKSVRVNRNLIVDRNIFDFLTNTNNIICSVILNANTEEGISYLSTSDKSDMISYLPSDKLKEEYGFDPFGRGVGRGMMKVGRVVNKLIPEKLIADYGVTPTNIEAFVNQYKSWFDKSSVEFKIVEGDEIRKWYLDRNYLTPNGCAIGNLWNSCMRYNERQKFLDLYCKNPNIKMLVMTTKQEEVEKVRARALLWDNVEVTNSPVELLSNIKVMDRIYTVFDSDVQTFKKWAEQNGYLTKWEQNAKSHQFFDVKGEPIKIKCKIKLPQSTFKHYPYLDTFPFYDLENGVLYNDEYNNKWEYRLVQANGSLTPPEPENDEYENEEDLIFDED